MLVVACNTASAVAINSLMQKTDIPVLGVIRAGAESAISTTRTNRIGVIGTSGTVNSNAYPDLLLRLEPEAEVFQNPAPLLVPLVEEGWTEGRVPALAVERYITPLVKRDIDVLLLGCTHYPLLKPVIKQTLAKLKSGAQVVDSAMAMAKQVEATLDKLDIRRSLSKGTLSCFVTDLPLNFKMSARLFLGQPVTHVEKIDI
jgi:glutamate racemase